MRPVSEIVVHCTATRPEWWATRTANQKVKEVRKWHLARGWSDIGYHYLIDRDGKIVEGRPLGRVGAHVKGKNTGTIGIALFGGHGSSENDQFEDHFTPEQDKALRSLIADQQGRFGDLKVSGHNQYSAKACPGFNAPRWYAKKPARKLTQSTTIRASAVTAASVATTAGATVGQLDDTAQLIVIGAGIIAFAALAWIARERIKKWARGIQ